MVEYANSIRKRVPFAYWIVYDIVIIPFLIWGLFESYWYVLPLALFVFAAIFDITEAIVKWSK